MGVNIARIGRVERVAVRGEKGLCNHKELSPIMTGRICLRVVVLS